MRQEEGEVEDRGIRAMEGRTRDKGGEEKRGCDEKPNGNVLSSCEIWQNWKHLDCVEDVELG